MKQVLHIFRKDTRRLGIEILAMLLALAVFAAFAPDQWDFSPEAMHRRGLTPLLLLLVPATWWLLMGRLIQAESLVGDRQFWVTRPYEWKQLLAAKVLFILLWVYVPFVLMQAAIVKQAGFSPLADAAGWAHGLVLVTGCVLLPLTVIAATTENFARMTLTMFGGVVTLVAGAYLVFSPSHGYESTTPGDHYAWVTGVLIAGALLAILLQYAMRRVWLARGVAIGAVVLATGLGMAMTALRDGQIGRLYGTTGAAPLQLAPATERKIVRIVPSERPGMVYLEMSIDFSGVAPGAAVQVDDVKAEFDDAGSGWHSATPWWSSRTLRILPGTHHGQVEVMLTREELKRFLASSATMQLMLAATELRAGGDAVAAIPAAGEFSVAGFGICSTRAWNHFSTQLICRAPLGQQPLTRVTATWRPKACLEGERMPDAEFTAETWNGTAYPGSVASFSNSLAYGVFPVRPELVNLYPNWHDGYDLFRTVGFALCPGTEVHFTRYDVTGRAQVSTAIPHSYFEGQGLEAALKDQGGEPR